MKVTAVETQKVVTLQLTERELVVLKAALATAGVSESATLSASKHGVNDLHDDDFTDLYGQVRSALEMADVVEPTPLKVVSP